MPGERMLRFPCIALFLAFAVSPALADRADADACAVKLAGLALDTYNNSIDSAARGRTLRQAIGGYLKPLHEAGKITEAEARKHGYAAAMCVRLVHRENRRRDRMVDTAAPPASYGTRKAGAQQRTTVRGGGARHGGR